MVLSRPGIERLDLGAEDGERFPREALNWEVPWERRGRSVPKRRGSACPSFVATGIIKAWKMVRRLVWGENRVRKRVAGRVGRGLMQYVQVTLKMGSWRGKGTWGHLP